ncbi:MAG TPA: hypothetical protein VD862_00100 [Candidatus Paceibacterota bacterium]|nr:hypothetical protein [Candidatus Paceibacterota bacterium]
MARHQAQKTEADYAPLVAKELTYYKVMARDLDISMDMLREAAELGLKDGMKRHRQAGCTHRESGCIAGSVRHFCDRLIVKACLMAASEEDMDTAEDVLMRLIED